MMTGSGEEPGESRQGLWEWRVGKFLDVQRGSRTETEVQWSAGAATGGGAR